MQRYDRAIYTILLLALLADIARAASPVVGVPPGGFMFAAAAQLPSDQITTAPNRSRPGSTPSASASRLAASRLSVLSRWPRVFRVSQSTIPAALTASLPATEAAGATLLALALPPAESRTAIFAHTASPAP